jgi:membrane associated rhomboid family serine protease
MSKISFSNLLIIISAIFTTISFIYPNILILWMNSYFLNTWNYPVFLVQMRTYSFLHWWLLHLFSNSIFLYIFWNPVEQIIWKKKFILFFISATIFNAIALSIFSAWNTIGISWFALAVLTYYTLILKSRNNPEYKWWIVAIVINILIWLDASISFVWHRAWAIFWIIFFYFRKK